MRGDRWNISQFYAILKANEFKSHVFLYRRGLIYIACNCVIIRLEKELKRLIQKTRIYSVIPPTRWAKLFLINWSLYEQRIMSKSDHTNRLQDYVTKYIHERFNKLVTHEHSGGKTKTRLFWGEHFMSKEWTEKAG